MDLLSEMYPVKNGVSAQTALRNVAVSASRLGSQNVSPNNAPIAMPLDTTFVKGRDKDTAHGLEILVGAVSQASDLLPGRVCKADPERAIHYFAAPFKLKDDCIRLGNAALTSRSPAEIEAFSDSARSVRAMAKSIGAPEKPISDWFHMSIRIRHVISVAEALEAPTESIALANNAVQKDLRQMRTELWKGDIRAVSRATRAVRPNLRSFRDEPPAPARKKRVRKPVHFSVYSESLVRCLALRSNAKSDDHWLNKTENALKAVMKKSDKYVHNPDARMVD